MELLNVLNPRYNGVGLQQSRVKSRGFSRAARIDEISEENNMDAPNRYRKLFRGRRELHYKHRIHIDE